MSFDRPWMLLAALAPLLWMAWQWRRTREKTPFVLKALALTAILLALAEPGLKVTETKLAVAVLVDTSASVSAADLKRASSIAAAIEREKGRHWVKVIPFARSTRPAAPHERGRDWALRQTAGEAARATDIESALREGYAALPAGLAGRLVLISDGKENRGSAVRAAWQARQWGVAVDTYALAGREQPSLRLEAVVLPPRAFTGERFPIDLVVSAPRNASGTVEITAEGRLLGSSPVSLSAGSNPLRVSASVSEPGAIDISGTVRAEGLGEVRFEQALAVRRPRVLLVSQDPPDAGAHLLKTLETAQFQVEKAAGLRSGSLDDYQVLVLNNTDLEAIPAPDKERIEKFVLQGGGLLVIGGERNIYLENKKEEHALDRAMPAKLAPPRSPEGTCVVLIVDKSSSMEGRKMELARLAAIGVIENLRPVDLVGVLIFDNSFQWAVPIRRAEDRSQIKRLVAGITPDGGTQIAPALSEAYRKALPAKATFKHIVLLTDGISEEGDSIALAKEAAGERITISTVGLGQDVNRAYLEKVAALAKGKSYFLVDPSGLEQILIKDVMEHTGSTAIEKPFTPVVLREAEILEGVEMAAAPALKGYVKFIAKPGADTILSIEKQDPLLVRWQHGLGRSAVFTSDAKPRWASEWVGWKGFDRFWANLFRDLLPHAQAGEARLDYEVANGDLVVEYRLARHVEEPATLPAIFVFGPGGYRKPVEVKKLAQGVFHGRINVGDRKGLFRVRPLEESRAFPEVGLYRQEDEMTSHGSDPRLLRRISDFTGGRFEPPPAGVFDPANRVIPASMRLWPALLALAIALNLAELVWRLGRDWVAAIRRRLPVFSSLV